MTFAASPTHLKRRLDEYLWLDRSGPLTKLREIFRAHFLPLGPTVILGGLVRDIAADGAEGFRSDVDLVLDAPPAAVKKLASRLQATENRFGGFGVSLPSWKIDFWALRNTWAHRAGHIRVRTLADVTKCTFFTMDAIAYDLEGRRLYARDEYIRDVHKRILEINLLPNPSVEGNLVRTVRRSLSKDLLLGGQLRDFVEEELNDVTYSYIVSTELRLYGYSFAQRYGSADQLREALIYPSTRVSSGVNVTNQYWLAF